VAAGLEEGELFEAGAELEGFSEGGQQVLEERGTASCEEHLGELGGEERFERLGQEAEDGVEGAEQLGAEEVGEGEVQRPVREAELRPGQDGGFPEVQLALGHELEEGAGEVEVVGGQVVLGRVRVGDEDVLRVETGARHPLRVAFAFGGFFDGVQQQLLVLLPVLLRDVEGGLLAGPCGHRGGPVAGVLRGVGVFEVQGLGLLEADHFEAFLALPLLHPAEQLAGESVDCVEQVLVVVVAG